jgi:hypothetical protein
MPKNGQVSKWQPKTSSTSIIAKFSLKIQFLLAITFDSWCFMSPAMARWKGLEK